MDAAAIESIIKAFRRVSVISWDHEHKVALVPDGCQVADLSKYLPPPARVRQRVELLTVESFLAYVNHFAGPASTIFANETSGAFEAVIDYHDIDDAREGLRRDLDHVARYSCPVSDEWKSWTGASGKWFEQVEFATFIESNVSEISKPPAAVLMQVALELQIHKSAEFESEVRLDNGQNRFRYQETIRGTTKAGDIEIPTGFSLQFPVFVDGAKHKLEARFRYRMDSGKLKLGFELIRYQEAWRAAVKEVTKAVAAGAPGVKLYAGVRA